MGIRVKAMIVLETELEIPEDYFEYEDGGCTMERCINRNMEEYISKIDSAIGCCFKAVESPEEGF